VNFVENLQLMVNHVPNVEKRYAVTAQEASMAANIAQFALRE